MLNNIIRILISLTVFASSIPADIHAFSNSLLSNKKRNRPSTLAPTSSFQSKAVLRDIFIDSRLSKDVRETAHRMMKSLSLFDAVTLAYVEILLTLKVWGRGQGKKIPKDVIKEVREVFSRWSGGFVAAARIRGLSEEELAFRADLFQKLEQGIRVLEIDQVGNRIFIMLSVFGKYCGLVLDPKLEGEVLMKCLSELRPLNLKTFVLLKRAQSLIFSLIGDDKDITFAQLCMVDPELSELEPILKGSPFPLIDLAEEQVVKGEDTSRVKALRDLMISDRPMPERIQAAADLIEALKESPELRGFVEDIRRFFVFISHRYELQGGALLVDPLCITPLKNLYIQLPERSSFRDYIAHQLRLLQAQFIRISDRHSIIYRVGGWNRFKSLTEYIQAFLGRVLGVKEEELILSEGMSPFRAQAFQRVWDKAPRILVDADMDLTYASELFRAIAKANPEVEVIGADKMLYGYLVRDPLDNVYLLDGEGKLTWSQVASPKPKLLNAQNWKGLTQKAREVFLREFESFRQSGNQGKITIEGFTIELISLISPKADMFLKKSPSFRAVERDAFSPFKEPVAIRLNFNHIIPYYLESGGNERDVVQWLNPIGLQMEEESIFVVGRGGAADLSYWIYQRVGDHLYLVDQAPLPDGSKWKGVVPAKIVLERPSMPPGLLSGIILPMISLFQNFFQQGLSWLGERASSIFMAVFTLLFLTGATPQYTQTSSTSPQSGLGQVDPHFRNGEFEFGMAFNQGIDYRLHFGADLSKFWRFDWRLNRSGLLSDTLHHGALDLIERTGGTLGLFTGYLAPLEYARAQREIPIGSYLTGMWFRYQESGSPFWFRFGGGISAFELPRLSGEQYQLMQSQHRPFGGFDLGLNLNFLDSSWLDWRDQIALSIYYQELLRDRMMNPEGVDSSHVSNRMSAVFPLVDRRLRIMTSMETAFDPQSIANVYFRTWQLPKDPTNDQIAREVIAWGTRYGGIMAFPNDERGVPINYELGPEDLLEFLDLRQNVGIRFRATPVLWHTFEGDVQWQPWDFLELRAAGGIALTWRPEIAFRLREIPKNFHKDYLKDEWSLGFDAIPFVRPSLWLAILRDLSLSIDFQGHWPDDLPFSHRFTARVRWNPEWLPALVPGLQEAGVGVFYRWSNHSDRFGTVQTLSSPPLHTIGFDTKLRWAPVEMKGALRTRKLAEIDRVNGGGVSLRALGHQDEREGPVGQFSKGVHLRLMRPIIRRTFEKFREKYPLADLGKFKIFVVDSQRLGGILHLDGGDEEVHLHQNLFRMDVGLGRSTFSRLWNISDEIEHRSELANFMLAHEAIRHPQLDVKHEDLLRLTDQVDAQVLKNFYETRPQNDQETLREMLEEAVVMYGDLVDDFLKGSEERQKMILTALEEIEPRDDSGNQPYRNLLSMSRFRGESSLIQYEILPFLLRDTRFGKILSEQFHTDFVRLAMLLRSQIDQVSFRSGGQSYRSTRRSFLEEGLLGSLLGVTAFVLEACGVSGDVWKLHRAEYLYIAEDEGRIGFGVSVVEGGKVSVLQNSVKAELVTDSDPEHQRGSNAAFILKTDTSIEPNESKHYVDLDFDFSGSPKENNPIFPATQGLNNYELIDFEYVTSGIDHLLHFIDSDHVSYLIPVKFENGDPNKLYRITIFDLVRALSINGLKVPSTKLYMRVPAGKPFIFNGWVKNRPPGPLAGSSSGNLRKRSMLIVPWAVETSA